MPATNASGAPPPAVSVVVPVRNEADNVRLLTDEIAAAFVGAFGAILVRNWFAARRLAFVPGTDGAVHALPGPSWRRIKAVARRLVGQ